MFGLSLGEIVVCAILALVVLGPKELPKVLGTLGRTVAKLRRMSTDLRKQSGIDEILREEGIQEELAALRALRGMSAAGVVDSFIESSSKAKRAAVLAAAATPEAEDPYAADDAPKRPELPPIELEGAPPDVAAEYPDVGCDAYGAVHATAPQESAPHAPAESVAAEAELVS